MLNKEEKIVRTFVSVAPTEAVLHELERLMQAFRRASEGCAYRWIRPSQLHITLKFLGEAPLSKVEVLRSALREIAVPPFSISLDEGGAFPNASAPRVVWLGVGEGGKALKNLAERVDFVSGECGFPLERRAFKAHLSIARSKEGDRVPAPLLFLLENLPPLVWRCASFSLMQSELTREGPIYTPVEVYPLD